MTTPPAGLVVPLDEVALATYRRVAEQFEMRAPELAALLLAALQPVIQGLPALRRFGPEIGLHIVPTLGPVALCEHATDLMLRDLAPDAEAAAASLASTLHRSQTMVTTSHNVSLCTRSTHLLETAATVAPAQRLLPPGVKANAPDAPAIAPDVEAKLPPGVGPAN